MAEILSKLGDFAFRSADLARAISPFTEAKIKRVTHKPCITTPMYIDLSLFLDDAEPAVQRQEPQLILYAGVLSFRKGVHILIQAFTQLATRHPHATLLLIGELVIGEGEYREEILRLIQNQGLRKGFGLIPFVKQKELKRYIDACALVVLPSFSEGLPRILMEAMACQRPVVVSAIDGPEGSSLLMDGMGCCLHLGMYTHWPNASQRFWNSPNWRGSSEQTAEALVQERYAEAAFIRGYTLLIETAIQQLPAQARKRLDDGEDSPCGH